MNFIYTMSRRWQYLSIKVYRFTDEFSDLELVVVIDLGR